MTDERKRGRSKIVYLFANRRTASLKHLEERKWTSTDS